MSDSEAEEGSRRVHTNTRGYALGVIRCERRKPSDPEYPVNARKTDA